MSAAHAVNQDADFFLVQRITRRWPRSVDAGYPGGWLLFELHDGKAFWLHVPTETLLESARNWGKKNG